MRIIRNKYIPLPRFKAINLFGFLFTRYGVRINEVTINHESIHTAQMKEMLYIFFYVWYGIEWLIRTISYSLRFLGRFIRDAKRKYRPKLTYRKLSLEREAYNNQYNFNYLKTRKRYAFIKQ